MDKFAFKKDKKTGTGYKKQSNSHIHKWTPYQMAFQSSMVS